MEKNRARIAEKAKEMFKKNGLEDVTMNSLAKEVGMSKSTLYAYFKSKDEVKNYILWESMEVLYTMFKEQLVTCHSARERFFSICNIMVKYKEKYPYNFDLLVKRLALGEKEMKEDEALPALYQVGEDINRLLFNWLGEDMQYTNQTEFSAKLLCLWGAVYGIITLAENRKDYIQNGLGVPKEEFLASAFECVYQSIDWKEGC